MGRGALIAGIGAGPGGGGAEACGPGVGAVINGPTTPRREGVLTEGWPGVEGRAGAAVMRSPESEETKGGALVVGRLAGVAVMRTPELEAATGGVLDEG
ncbi:MAG: hypothetical protein JNM69_24660 [Archangium sp.]|nr:hypothetical protein [Archangium sp.]